MARVAADVILAECFGQAWLVRGEQHIDDLLGNTLKADVTIEVVSCESKSEVDALWRSFGGGCDEDDTMWLIHPAIAARTRGKVAAAAGAFEIAFAEWSAAIDDAAASGLQAAADAATAQPLATLAVISRLAEDAPAMAADMAGLRSALLEARLVTLGIAATRLVRETQIAGPGQSDRIGLVIRGVALPG